MLSSWGMMFFVSRIANLQTALYTSGGLFSRHFPATWRLAPVTSMLVFLVLSVAMAWVPGQQRAGWGVPSLSSLLLVHSIWRARIVPYTSGDFPFEIRTYYYYH